ncbi:MAG: MBL fold metallo-hydrolase [Thermoplasmata archaeon]
MSSGSTPTRTAINIRVLVENTAFKNHPGAHGLALLIWKEGGQPVLFDAGPRWDFLMKAVEDVVLANKLSPPVKAVLSHGHYDHADALPEWLSYTSYYLSNNSLESGIQPEIYTGREAFRPKFRKSAETTRYIGVPEILRKKNDKNKRGDLEAPEQPEVFRHIVVEDVLEVVPGIWAVGNIPRRNGFEKTDKNFLVEKKDGLMPDEFEDEIFLLCSAGEGYAVITGCSHRGICNILQHASGVASTLGISGQCRAVVGGFHLESAPQSRIDFTVQHFMHLFDTPAQPPISSTQIEKETVSPDENNNSLDSEGNRGKENKTVVPVRKRRYGPRILSGHCTGFEAECAFRNAGFRIEILKSGLDIVIS